MNVTIPKKTLLNLLARVEPTADKKSAMPALANVLLDARDGALHVATTDLYMSARGNEPADVTTPGSIAVPAKDILERVKQMPDGPVLLLATDATLTMKAVGTARRFSLQGISGTEFPKLPVIPVDDPISVDAKALLSMFVTTFFSISTDETRPNVNSALLKIGAGQLVMVSTDGHRLSKATLVAEVGSAPTMLVPRKACENVKKLLSETTGNAEIRADNINVFFTLGNFTFSAKMVDATFPPYEQVIPAHSSQFARLPRAALIEAVKAVKLASSDATGGIKLAFGLAKLIVSAESPNAGQGFDEVPCDGVRDEVTIGVNAAYMLDVLGAIEGEEVQLGITGDLDPILVKPIDGEYVGVVMPLRT